MRNRVSRSLLPDPVCLRPRYPLRVKALLWGNLAIGVLTPIGNGFNILGALGVFSVEWAAGSILCAVVFSSVLGYLTWTSGWRILDAHPNAFQRTCVAGGLTLGYTGTGILILTTAGIDRGLEILIRHGSQDWWNWSLSHFQNSGLREIPLLAWWIFALGTVVRYRLQGASGRMWDRFTEMLFDVSIYVIAGYFARVIQLAKDTLLSSQR